jgi:hypothetical protein
MIKGRYRVILDCNNTSCVNQFKGECRATKPIRCKDGSFSCPYEDTRKLREYTPTYIPYQAKRRS